VGTIVTYLNTGINMSVDELSKHFLKCLPDSFSTPLRDYIHTYKTATVSGRYLYKSEAWNLKMTLMVLEAFMTYSLKRVSELQGMLPSSTTQRSSASSLLRSPAYSTAPFQLAAPTKLPPPQLPSPHPVPAFGISASVSQPSTAPSSTQAAHSKPVKPQPPGPHASIPLSPTWRRLTRARCMPESTRPTLSNALTTGIVRTSGRREPRWWFVKTSSTRHNTRITAVTLHSSSKLLILVAPTAAGPMSATRLSHSLASGAFRVLVVAFSTIANSFYFAPTTSIHQQV
jgi:hypothetical protein